VAAFEAAEELLQDVVGALRLNQDRPGGSLHGHRIGKELYPVLVDLFDHLVCGTSLGVVLSAGPVELLDDRLGIRRRRLVPRQQLAPVRRRELG
jgi:hypothetical protein